MLLIKPPVLEEKLTFQIEDVTGLSDLIHFLMLNQTEVLFMHSVRQIENSFSANLADRFWNLHANCQIYRSDRYVFFYVFEMNTIKKRN